MTSTPSSPSKTDLMYEILYNPVFVPLPSSKVNIKTTVVDGKPSYLMKNHATGAYYDIDELTNHIWNLIDGKRTVTQIIEEVQRQRPRIQEKTVVEMLLFFAESNLLTSSLEPAAKKKFRIVSAFEIDLSIIEKSNDFLRSVYSKIRPVFRRPLLWAAIAFIAVSALLFAGKFASIFGQKANFEILGSTVVGFFFYYFVALAPVIAIHEIAHGLTLVHYGGKPGEIGTGLLYFGPMFYIETTDAWGLSRRERIMVYLSGGITTLLIGSALVILQLIVNIAQPLAHILTMMSFYCFNMTLFNLAPPFETDGYYVLSDVVNIPTLRQDSYAYLWSLIKRAVGKRTKISGLTKRKKRIFIGYAILSVTWIVYIVFQSSLFLVYMGQDVTIALSNIVQAGLSSQVIQASAVLIAVASTAYFGMQIMGYGFVFWVAAKKAMVKSLQVEAIHDRDLAVFTYLPPQAPESLTKDLRTKMEKTAEKLTPNFEIIQSGRSLVTILRIGGTKLALVQIKEHIKRIEDEFNSGYQKLITRHRDMLQKSIGIHSSNKAELTTMFERVANESANTGNSTAQSIVRHCQQKQDEALLYLLNSVFGTVWTIEVQPAQEYEIQKELLPGLVLEDLTFTDLYNDTENFKKEIIYGFDSLAKLVTEINIGAKECLARPDVYQLVCVLEPIKSRIVIAGRTEEMEKKIQAFSPLFVAYAWSGYMDNLLSETCFRLSTLNRTRLPSVKDIEEMSIGELAVLTKDLSALTANQTVVNECIEDSENHLATINQNLQQLRTTLKPSETFRIGLLDTVFHVNAENLDKVPKRIKDFQKQWKTISKQIEKTRQDVEREHQKRMPAAERRKTRVLKFYPLIVVFSLVFFVLGLLTSSVWQISFVSVGVISQLLYFVVMYRVWRSLNNATSYPSHAFSMIHLYILALLEAIYGYVTTEDILTPT